MVKEYEVFNLLRDNLATPSTFIIDQNGVIQWKYVARGINDRPSVAEIVQILDKING